MRAFDFFILTLCCFVWGSNFVISKWMLTDLAIPPLFFAAVRFGVVAILLAKFLFPIPKGFVRLCMAGICVGAVHLAFLYTGLKTAPASSGSIVAQMQIPFVVLLSVVFLGERIGLWRTLGIIGAMAGVVILVYDPGALGFDTGLIYIILSYLSLAVGAVLIKGVGDIGPMQYVAWMGVLAVPILGLGSFLFEANQITLGVAAGWKMGFGIAFCVLATSIFAHGQYFRLLKRYDVSMVVPLTLMIPFWAVLQGVLIRGEPLGPRFLLGAAFILVSVYVIAKRTRSAED